MLFSMIILLLTTNPAQSWSLPFSFNNNNNIKNGASAAVAAKATNPTQSFPFPVPIPLSLDSNNNIKNGATVAAKTRKQPIPRLVSNNNNIKKGATAEPITQPMSQPMHIPGISFVVSDNNNIKDGASVAAAEQPPNNNDNIKKRETPEPIIQPISQPIHIPEQKSGIRFVVPNNNNIKDGASVAAAVQPQNNNNIKRGSTPKLILPRLVSNNNNRKNAEPIIQPISLPIRIPEQKSGISFVVSNNNNIKDGATVAAAVQPQNNNNNDNIKKREPIIQPISQPIHIPEQKSGIRFVFSNNNNIKDGATGAAAVQPQNNNNNNNNNNDNIKKGSTPEPIIQPISQPIASVAAAVEPQNNNNNNNNIKKGSTPKSILPEPTIEPTAEPTPKRHCIFEKSGFCQVSCRCDSDYTKNSIINQCNDDLCAFYDYPQKFSDFHSYITDAEKYFMEINKNPESKKGMELRLEFFLKTKNFDSFYSVKWMCCTSPFLEDESNSKCYYDNTPNLEQCVYPEWKELDEHNF